MVNTLSSVPEQANVVSLGAEGPLEGIVRPGAFLPGTAAVGLAAVADCPSAHPNADSPEMLHAVWAPDISQLEGVAASVASVVASTTSPLTVHIVVRQKFLGGFKERFGARGECRSTVTTGGVLIRIYGIDAQLGQRPVAQTLLKQRGPENFARFYMHLVLERTIVIYLDADAIVQADLGQLRKELKASGKTIGFVNRTSSAKMEQLVGSEKALRVCGLEVPEMAKLMSATAYDVGVYAVDLQRWADAGVSRRVEELVAQHTACGGKMWIGGSQPLLLLAFFARKPDEPEDFTVFENVGDLGWRDDPKEKALRTNGNLKPWNEGGLNASRSRPHRDRFTSTRRPYDAGQEAVKDPEEDAAEEKDRNRPESTTSTSQAMIDAQAKCTGVVLLDDWTVEEQGRCEIGTSFGCPSSGSGMWTKGGCTGLFSVDSQVTVCGGQYKSPCAAGSLPQPKDKCSIMILTTYFTTIVDWQRQKKAEVDFWKIEQLYKGVIQLGLNMTLVYDELPENVINTYTCDRFHFERVNLNDFDRRYGVNDVRYFFFQRLVSSNGHWQTIFIIDAFDVQVVMNPCSAVKRGTLYVGTESDDLRRHPWMAVRFKHMGGKYLTWFEKVLPRVKIVNCGLTGGSREIMLQLLGQMVQVLSDPAMLIMRKRSEEINVNMAALNYIVYNVFQGKFTGGAPMHSKYKSFETNRTDVWFIHK